VLRASTVQARGHGEVEVQESEDLGIWESPVAHPPLSTMRRVRLEISTQGKFSKVNED